MTKPPRQWNSTLPQRSRPPKRSGRPKRKTRSKSEFARIYGTSKLAYVKAWTCLAWRVLDTDCAGKIEAAHTQNGGMGRKAGAETLVPLCHKHHRELHECGVRTFETAYGLDLHAEARRVEAAFQAHLASRSPAPSENR